MKKSLIFPLRVKNKKFYLVLKAILSDSDWVLTSLSTLLPYAGACHGELYLGKENETVEYKTIEYKSLSWLDE